MCKIFSCEVTKSCKGYYDNKIHSHSEVNKMYVKDDPELQDNKLPPNNTFVKCEITPKNGNIVLPDEWELNVDEEITPEWFKKRHEEKAWECHSEWLKWFRSKVDDTKYPKNPFLMKPEPFNKLDNSIRGSIRDSIWDSIRGSIWDSIWLHVGNMCKIDIKEGKQIIDLWEKGIIPVWYQDAWHYYGSPNGDGKCEEIKESK
jgi:hypothetical protein